MRSKILHVGANVAIVAVALSLLALAGPAFAADTTTPSAPNRNALKSYQKCMKVHGVNVKLPENWRRTAWQWQRSPWWWIHAADRRQRPAERPRRLVPR